MKFLSEFWRLLSASRSAWLASAYSEVIMGVSVWPGDPEDDPVAALWAVGCLLLGGPIGSPALGLPF